MGATSQQNERFTGMSDQKDPKDAEGHRAKQASDDDTEGHRAKQASDDDTEGHRAKV